MNQLKFYKYAALGLLILNLSMIAFFFLTKPKDRPMRPPGQEGFQHRAIDILKLDEGQHDLFLKSARSHDEKMNAFDSQQKELLKNYFHSLTDTSLVAASEKKLNAFTRLEQQKIESTYQHFNEIKAILKPEQMDGFKVFMDNILKKILPERKKNPPPPKGK